MVAKGFAYITALFGQTRRIREPAMQGDRRRTMPRLLAVQPHYALLTGGDRRAPHPDMLRLDEPDQATDPAVRHGEGVWTVGAWVGRQSVGVASVSRQQPPGPPMHGFFYRIHGVAVRAAECEQGYGKGLIECCIAHVAANGGRTLWARVPLTAVDLWRWCGFAIAGPPAATKSKHVWVFMVRRVAPADAETMGEPEEGPMTAGI